MKCYVVLCNQHMLLYIVIRDGKQYTCDMCMRIEKLSREKHEVELIISDSQGHNGSCVWITNQ